MNPESRHTLLCLSSLLRYPDTELLDTLQTIRNAAPPEPAALPPAIGQFLAYAHGRDIMDLQSTHVGTFDTDAKACLYLASHVYGDSPRQGQALAALHAVYRDAGFIPLPGEMPDYLPLVLEFLSVAPPWACTTLCGLFGPSVEKMSRHLHDNNNPYAPLLHSAWDVLLAHMPKEKENA